MDDEEATLEGQFVAFSRLLDNKRSGTTMTLWRSDYWMRQANILDDRHITMTDTGLAWFKFSKSELTFDEWHEVIVDLCEVRNIDLEYMEVTLTNCGIPGTTVVTLPQYRDYFNTYKPKSKLVL